jgi:hypothetical protein
LIYADYAPAANEAELVNAAFARGASINLSINLSNTTGNSEQETPANTGEGHSEKPCNFGCGPGGRRFESPRSPSLESGD